MTVVDNEALVYLLNTRGVSIQIMINILYLTTILTGILIINARFFFLWSETSQRYKTEKRG